MKSVINKDLYPTPLIFNCYKPKGISSFDIVRHFKKNLPEGYGKIGHFGTLDPFACGVLMIGVAGAARLNNYIHDCLPKTYIATGILGQESKTGDTTEGIDSEDNSDYLKKTISKFGASFIEEKLKEEFLGEYWQSPHKYSAAKFEGKKLHQWAREGIEIQKEKKLRRVYGLKVISYDFPVLKIEFTVSSGTYIRTLFSDCANYLGTLGVLEDLERTHVGGCNLSNAIDEKDWPKSSEFDFENLSLGPKDVLEFNSVKFLEKESKLFSNGVSLLKGRESEVIYKNDQNYYWIEDMNNKLIGLASLKNGHYVSEFNFPSSSK